MVLSTLKSLLAMLWQIANKKYETGRVWVSLVYLLYISDFKSVLYNYSYSLLLLPNIRIINLSMHPWIVILLSSLLENNETKCVPWILINNMHLNLRGSRGMYIK